MNWLEWAPLYTQIVQDLDLDRKADEEASQAFDQLVRSLDLEVDAAIETIGSMCTRSVIVLGAAPSLDHDLAALAPLLDDVTTIAADGAARAFIKEEMIPNIVVTDLDGLGDKDLIFLASEGVVTVVHAHGDNCHRWSALPAIARGGRDRMVPTVQTRPLSFHVRNFGGFTDGDRAVFLAESFHPPLIALAGFDLSPNAAIGSYSKPNSYDFLAAPEDASRKAKKLKVAKWLLEEHLPKTSTRLYDLSSTQAEPIRGFSRTGNVAAIVNWKGE